jgi:predicted nucleotidyltransferase component of viral defense system
MENNMITKEELKKYAVNKNLNLGQAEKDYYQNIVLFCVYKIYANEIIFKGGTALSKCYGLDRFSEDLDFTANSPFSTTKLKEQLNKFMKYEIIEKTIAGNNLKITLNINGPLYNGIKHSTCKLILDISYRENVLKTPNIKKIISEYEIPSFDVYVMTTEEIFSEKIRAIMTREKARDVYDLYFLIARKTEINKELINQKLKYYNETFSLNKFIEKLENKEKIWETELPQLIQNVPNFKEVKKEIISSVKKSFP